MDPGDVKKLIGALGEIESLGEQELGNQNSSCLEMKRLRELARGAAAEPHESGHISSCTHCQHRIRAFRKMDEEANSSAVEPSSSTRPVTPVRRSLSRPLRLVVAAAAAVLLAAGWWFWKPASSSPVLLANVSVQILSATDRSAVTEPPNFWVTVTPIVRSSIRLLVLDQAGGFTLVVFEGPQDDQRWIDETYETQQYLAASVHTVLTIASSEPIPREDLLRLLPAPNPDHLQPEALQSVVEMLRRELKADVRATPLSR
jgi:hypothetical protein